MSIDHYRSAAEGWARGASLVYAAIAALLVERTPITLSGALVLDVGAGTGACEAPLSAAGVALTIEADLSYEMLAWNRARRPPAVVCDVMRLPMPSAIFDAAIASFVLNHLRDPLGGIVELARTLRPGGAVLATVLANSSKSANRDAVDEVARAHGWRSPEWYGELKATVAPMLGEASLMKTVASAAALIDIDVNEEPVEVDVTEPGALVDYRFGQAHFADWLASLDQRTRAKLWDAATVAIAGEMEPYRPRVVFLTARTAP